MDASIFPLFGDVALESMRSANFCAAIAQIDRVLEYCVVVPVSFVLRFKALNSGCPVQTTQAKTPAIMAPIHCIELSGDIHPISPAPDCRYSHMSTVPCSHIVVVQAVHHLRQPSSVPFDEFRHAASALRAGPKN